MLLEGAGWTLETAGLACAAEGSVRLEKVVQRRLYMARVPLTLV